MPVNQIQFATRQPKKDAMDKILQGLQIAEAAFKIPVNYQQYRAYSAEAGMKEDERAGISTRAKIGGAGGTIVPRDASGLTPQRYGAPLTPMKVREGDSVVDVDVANPEADRKFFEGEAKLRNDYEKHGLTTDTNKALLNAKKALEVLNKNRGMGTDDIAAIYGFYHTIESQSAVKEGEFASAANAAGLFQKLANLDEQIKKGAIMGPTGREAMKRTIGDIVNAQLAVQDVLDDRYTDMANDQKFKAKNVVTGFWAQDDSPIRPLKRPEKVDQGDWEKLSRVNKRKLLQAIGRKPNSDEE